MRMTGVHACTIEPLCARDMVLGARQKGSVATGDGGFHVSTWSTMSQPRPSVAVGGCVAIRIVCRDRVPR